MGGEGRGGVRVGTKEEWVFGSEILRCRVVGREPCGERESLVVERESLVVERESLAVEREKPSGGRESRGGRLCDYWCLISV